jgi:hypothetical protein
MIAFPQGEKFQLDPIFGLFAMTKPTGIRFDGRGW